MKKFILTSIVFGCIYFSYSQISKKEENRIEEPYFYEIVEKMEELVKLDRNETQKDEKKTSKQFERWKSYWLPRIGKYGKLSTTSKQMNNTINSSNFFCSSPATWNELGPTSFPQNNSNNQRGIGRLDFVKLHPKYNGTTNQTVFAGGIPGLWISKNNGDKWTNLNSDHFEVSACSDIAIMEDSFGTEILLSATGAKKIGSSEISLRSIGLKRSINGGSTWTTINLEATPWNIQDKNTITEIAVDPNANNRIYVAVSQFTWSPVNDYFNTTSVRDHDKGKLFVSEDYGLTWNKIYEGFSIQDIEFKTNDPNYLYLSGHKLVKVRRLGINNYSFTDLTGKLIDPNNSLNNFNFNNLNWWNGQAIRMDAEVTRANSDVVYVYGFFFDSNNTRRKVIWKSTDNGISFTTTNTNTTPGHNWYRGSIEVSHQDENTLFFGANQQKGAISTDGGSSWDYTPLNSVHADTNDFDASHLNPDYVFLANDAGVYRSFDHGNTWQISSEGLGVGEIYDIGMSLRTNPSIPDIIQGGFQDVNCMVGTSQSNWLNSNGTSGDGMVCIVDPTNPNIVYSEAQNGIIRRSTNGGITFSPYYVGGFAGGAWVTPMTLDPNNTNRLFVGKNDVWVRNGSSITQLPNNNRPGNQTIIALKVAPSNSNIIYAAYEQGIANSSMTQWWGDPNRIMERQLFKSIDGGNSWIDISPRQIMKGSNGTISSIEIDTEDANKIWITYNTYGSRYKVLSSKSGGDNDDWLNYSQGLPNVPVNKIIMTPTHNNPIKKHDFLYLATDFGVYYRNTNMSQWECYSDGIPNVSVMDIEIDEYQNIIRCATYGRGVWQGGLHPEDRAYNNSSFAFQTSCAADGTTSVEVTPSDQTLGVNHSWTLIQTSAPNQTGDSYNIQQIGSSLCCSSGTKTFTGLEANKYYYIKHGVWSSNHGWQETRTYIPTIQESISSEFHFEDANGQIKTSFCSADKIYLNGVACESETQYFMDAWKRPLGSSGSFSYHANYGWTSGQLGLINLRDAFLNHGQNPGEQFIPGYEYQIKIAVANNPCVGWLSSTKTFSIPHCFSSIDDSYIKFRDQFLQNDELTATPIKSYNVKPNPSNGIFEVQSLERNSTHIHYRVFNQQGKTLIEQHLKNQTNFTINLSKFSSGIYYLDIYTDHKNEKIKLIKK
ncbi:T9SS type A sorting domain-containing protein [Tenacibaculum agarivorans]|uniref:T9SS type A sorting domain-containing protein n=1 Tax=Tenacibaculum agarivorans TaxID=1908389 RepID=UPI00094B9C9F|nr:T9SS type A sorting domain-containing protein [Tenacibaculum agarivorans]